jgi:hypothetical protein
MTKTQKLFAVVRDGKYAAMVGRKKPTIHWLTILGKEPRCNLTGTQLKQVESLLEMGTYEIVETTLKYETASVFIG